MTKVIFHDTFHNLPWGDADDQSGKELERKIREAVQNKNYKEEVDRQRKEALNKEKIAEERKNVERALGEFLGYEMWPTPRAEFEGANRHGQDYWELRVGRLVFKLNRITSHGSTNDQGKRLKQRDFSFQVCTEFERVYGSRRLRDIAKSAGQEECKRWEWHQIDSLADIAKLRSEGKLEDR